MNLDLLKRLRGYTSHSLMDFMNSMAITILRFVDKTKLTLLNKTDVFSDRELFDYCTILVNEIACLRKSRKYPDTALELSIKVLDDIQNGNQLREYIEESARPHRVYLYLLAGHKYSRQFGLKHDQ